MINAKAFTQKCWHVVRGRSSNSGVQLADTSLILVEGYDPAPIKRCERPASLVAYRHVVFLKPELGHHHNIVLSNR
jgi:hypothetical protein